MKVSQSRKGQVDRSLCGPRVLAQMDPEKQPYKVSPAAITNEQLAGAGGAQIIVLAVRAAEKTKTNS